MAAGTEGLRPLVDEDAADDEATAATEEWTRAEGSGAYPAGIVATAAAIPPDARVRRFHVVAEPRRLVYRDPELVDPFVLVYRPGGRPEMRSASSCPAVPEPLVLRCCEGELVEVTVENHLPALLLPEPFAPAVPVEARDARTFRPIRPVSSRVSMHADMLLYDVTQDDGANIGMNPEQTIAPGGGPPI